MTRACWFGLLLVISIGCWASTVKGGIVVKDDLGNELVLSKPATRIISLSPHLTENLFSVGAGDRIIGVTRYSDYPQEAALLPMVGDAQALNTELIVSLKPDLIVAWADGGNLTTLAQLEKLGIPVYWSKPITLLSIARELTNLGALVGQPEVGQAVSLEFKAKLAELSKNQNKKRLAVFYQVWSNPLQTLNRNTLINSLIELCGGENIFANVNATVAQVDVESVVAADPDLILGSHVDDKTATWKDYWQQWPSLSAVKRNHVISLNADTISRHSVRVLDGAGAMCAQFDVVRAAR